MPGLPFARTLLQAVCSTFLPFREAWPAKGAIFQRGSGTPLVLMMGIFLTKYAVGVTPAMQPNHAHELLFAAGVCALYGLFNGVFIGQVLRVFSIYRRA